MSSTQKKPDNTKRAASGKVSGKPAKRATAKSSSAQKGTSARKKPAAYAPDLVSRGFVYVRESEELMEGARKLVIQTFEKCRSEHVRDWNSVKTRVREALSSYIYRKTKRSPMILPILMEI